MPLGGRALHGRLAQVVSTLHISASPVHPARALCAHSGACGSNKHFFSPGFRLGDGRKATSVVLWTVFSQLWKEEKCLGLFSLHKFSAIAWTEDTDGTFDLAFCFPQAHDHFCGFWFLLMKAWSFLQGVRQ